MLRKERHYMFVIGAVDVIPIGSNVQIEDINNISCIQFRTFQEPIVQQVLVNYIDFDARAGQIPIKRYNISKDANGKKISEYMFEYERRPYNVHIFHSTDSDYEYVPDGNLLSALITWDTMIMASIDVGAPPQAQTNVGSESPRFKTEMPLQRQPPPQMVNENELQFERRARAQVRPSKYTIPPSGPLPPPQPSRQYHVPPPPVSQQQGQLGPLSQPPPPPQQGPTRYPLGPLSQPPPTQQQGPVQPLSEPQRVPRPRGPTPPPKRRVAFKEPEFNPRPGSRKTSEWI